MRYIFSKNWTIQVNNSVVKMFATIFRPVFSCAYVDDVPEKRGVKPIKLLIQKEWEFLVDSRAFSGVIKRFSSSWYRYQGLMLTGKKIGTIGLQ